jgi:hypothetical protein
MTGFYDGYTVGYNQRLQGLMTIKSLPFAGVINAVLAPTAAGGAGR